MNNIAVYTNSIIQDFESFLRTEVDLVEDCIRVVLEEYNSKSITDELLPGIYTSKDFSEVLFRILQFEYEGVNNTVDSEFDETSMKTKMVVRPGNTAIRFDEKSIFSIIIGFAPYWVHKHYKGYISQRILNLCTTNKIHLKGDVIDGSVVMDLGQPMFHSFVLGKPPGYKVFSELETIH